MDAPPATFELNWKEHFVFVAEIHQRAERKSLGNGKLERTSGDACGQRPFDVGRFAGVAGILPVDVPAGFELEVESAAVGSAGVNLRVGADELDVDVRQIGGTRGKCGQCRGERSDERDDCSKESH